jgi:branched-chain amino acid transport system substrate-binding protein
MVRSALLAVSIISAVVLSATTARAEILIGLPAPLTGTMAWIGEQYQKGVEMAAAELNGAGGVLGQPLRVVAADDYCDGAQAVAAAKKLIAAGAAVIAGHVCSGASIPASALYEAAGVVMISPSTNPTLTEQGFAHVFRIAGRDDEQARMAADYLTKDWADANIAILHDGGAYGQGVAEETRRQLHQRGMQEAMFAQITPGQPDYAEMLSDLKAADISVLFYGGYPAEAGLIMREASARAYHLQLVGPDTLNSEYFLHVAGRGAEGVRFVSLVDPRTNEAAAPIIDLFRAQGYEPEGFTLQAYAIVQVWAQAVAKAGSLKDRAVINALRGNTFETLLGRIGFDQKGDVTGSRSFAWYVWRDGAYVPLE